jgi:hypothetical protein
VKEHDCVAELMSQLEFLKEENAKLDDLLPKMRPHNLTCSENHLMEQLSESLFFEAFDEEEKGNIKKPKTDSSAY